MPAAPILTLVTNGSLTNAEVALLALVHPAAPLAPAVAAVHAVLPVALVSAVSPTVASSVVFLVLARVAPANFAAILLVVTLLLVLGILAKLLTPPVAVAT